MIERIKQIIEYYKLTSSSFADKIDVPIVLLAAATWCAPCWGEIPALNKMVEKYDGKVKFIMLFWDTEKGVKRMAKKLDKRIFLVASKELTKNRATIRTSGFIHKLDYPSTYLITENKTIAAPINNLTFLLPLNITMSFMSTKITNK